jgi:hypothetical protein
MVFFAKCWSAIPQPPAKVGTKVAVIAVIWTKGALAHFPAGEYVSATPIKIRKNMAANRRTR